eukprot:2008395-Pyramimonas_sp.AAC.1
MSTHVSRSSAYALKWNGHWRRRRVKCSKGAVSHPGTLRPKPRTLSARKALGRNNSNASSTADAVP